ncbi:DsrE family protein [Thiobacillus sp.]|uniref:DsrE family protein n=1 Tax=Thiobacillus sp. TaxID=924 RepID=UPI0026011E6B|nr:DsrE family protein [Thiobacillus sp.]
MKRYLPYIGLVAAIAAASAQPVLAAEFAPYGTAKVDLRETLATDVLFDVNYAEPQQLHGLYNYVKNMQKATKGKLVVLTRGPELRAFAKENYLQYQDIVDKMAALAKDGVEFRMCGNAMKAAGFQAEDVHGFITVAAAGGFPELVYWMGKGYEIINQSVNPTPLPVRDARYLDQPGLRK